MSDIEPATDEQVDWLRHVPNDWTDWSMSDRELVGDALPGLIARIDQERDRPEFDGTDAAHPAWWRGQQYGAESTAYMLGRVASHGAGPGVCANEIIERAKRDIDALRTELSAERQRREAAEKKLGRTRDGVTVGPGDTVYSVFPGDRSVTALRVGYPHAHTQTYEWSAVHDCYSTREAAADAAKESK